MAVFAGTKLAYAALYTTVPTATAAGTEVTGGSYARKSASWTAGTVDGSITVTVVFDVPAGVTVAGAGFHSALTAGVYIDGGAVTSQNFATAGQYTLTVTFVQN
jgi:hypothetical protein